MMKFLQGISNFRIAGVLAGVALLSGASFVYGAGEPIIRSPLPRAPQDAEALKERAQKAADEIDRARKAGSFEPKKAIKPDGTNGSALKAVSEELGLTPEELADPAKIRDNSSERLVKAFEDAAKKQNADDKCQGSCRLYFGDQGLGKILSSLSDAASKADSKGREALISLAERLQNSAILVYVLYVSQHILHAKGDSVDWVKDFLEHMPIRPEALTEFEATSEVGVKQIQGLTEWFELAVAMVENSGQQLPLESALWAALAKVTKVEDPRALAGCMSCKGGACSVPGLSS